MQNEYEKPKLRKDADAEIENSTNKKELLGGEYVINPNGSNNLILEEKNLGYTKEIRFNSEISLGDIRQIKDLENYLRYTPGQQLIKNSIEKGEINDEIILNLLEWDKGMGYDREYSFIEPLARRGMLSPVIIEWLLENRKGRKSDSVVRVLIENNILSEDQIKKIIIEGEDGLIKDNLLFERYLVNIRKFSIEERMEIVFNVSVDKQHYLFEKILRLLPEEKRAVFIEKILAGAVEFYEKHADENKGQKNDKNKKLMQSLPQEFQFLVRNITENYKYLADKQIIELMQVGYPFVRFFDDNMPGWVFRGLQLKYKNGYGQYASWERRALEDFGKEEYKEKYKIVESIFSEEPMIKEIMTEKEINEIINEIKDFGCELFNPVYVSHTDEKNTWVFKHISGKPGLKILLPDSSRKTNRSLDDLAIYLQYNNYKEWQLDYLKEVNGKNLYTYSVTLPKKMMDDKVVYEDGRWDGGYKIEKPIILNPEVKFTWEIFNFSMKTRAISYYEEINGKLPNEIKQLLLKEK